MIDFWLSKNIADTLYGLIVLAMFFIIMFIVSAFNRHNKKKFYKQFKESKRKDDKNNG